MGKPMIRVSGGIKAAVALASCLLLVVACRGSDSEKPRDTATTSRTIEATSATGVSVAEAERNSIWGASGDALDDPSTPSMTLDEAMDVSGISVSLPATELVGAPVRVVLNETVDDPTGKGRVGLMVLFDTGVKMVVEPGEVDLVKLNRSVADSGMMKFKDGRKRVGRIERVGGRDTLLEEAGVQAENGYVHPVEARVTWNLRGLEYVLRAPLPSKVPSTTSLADAVVNAAQLKQIAASVK